MLLTDLLAFADVPPIWVARAGRALVRRHDDAHLVTERLPDGDPVLVLRAHVQPLQGSEIVFHDVADQLARIQRVGGRRHGPAGAALVEQAHQGAEHLRRCAEAGIGLRTGVRGGGGVLQIRDARLRAIHPVANPHEQRRPLRAELLRHDVIERAVDRHGVEFVRRVEAEGVSPAGGNRLTGEVRSRHVQVGVVRLSAPRRRGARAPVALRPLVHPPDAAGDEDLAGERRERGEVRRHEVACGQGAVRLRGEELRRDAPVVGEHRDELLLLGSCLPLRRALCDRGEKRRSDGRSAQTPEEGSSLNSRFHVLNSSSFREHGRANGRNPPASDRRAH